MLGFYRNKTNNLSYSALAMCNVIQVNQINQCYIVKPEQTVELWEQQVVVVATCACVD